MENKELFMFILMVKTTYFLYFFLSFTGFPGHCKRKTQYFSLFKFFTNTIASYMNIYTYGFYRTASIIFKCFECFSFGKRSFKNQTITCTVIFSNRHVLLEIQLLQVKSTRRSDKIRLVEHVNNRQLHIPLIITIRYMKKTTIHNKKHLSRQVTLVSLIAQINK